MTPAALYVHRDTIYREMGLECWDEARDARTYAGPAPVVAHPPCERWGRLELGWPGLGRRYGQDGGCFAAALTAIRTWGGVIEHPQASGAWATYHLPRPPRAGGWVRDLWGMWSCEIWQGAYGFHAPKPTWLAYYSPAGTPPLEMDWRRIDPGGRVQDLPGKGSGARAATPPRLAAALVALAGGAA